MVNQKIWNTKEWRSKSKDFVKGKKCQICGSEKSLTPHHLEKSEKVRRLRSQLHLEGLTKKDVNSIIVESLEKEVEVYLSLENCIVLCKNCHRKVESGYVLCKMCKKELHKPVYKQCWSCLPKDFKEKYEGELIKLPCGSEINLKKGFLEVLGIFHACLSYCPNGKNIYDCWDFQRWEENNPNEGTL